LQILLQGSRLKICRALPEAATLVKELENYRLKITAAAHETFGAASDSLHDDLLTALALACWLPESRFRWPLDSNTEAPEEHSLIAKMPKDVFLDGSDDPIMEQYARRGS
jgi:hypothetical protein